MQTALWDTRRMCLLVLVLATVWATSPALLGDPAPPVFPIAYSVRIREVATQGPRPSTPPPPPRHLPNVMDLRAARAPAPRSSPLDREGTDPKGRVNFIVLSM